MNQAIACSVSSVHHPLEVAMEGILFTVLLAVYLVTVKKQLTENQSSTNEDTNVIIAEK
jgi:hypothetical protein